MFFLRYVSRYCSITLVLRLSLPVPYMTVPRALSESIGDTHLLHMAPLRKLLSRVFAIPFVRGD